MKEQEIIEKCFKLLWDSNWNQNKEETIKMLRLAIQEGAKFEREKVILAIQHDLDMILEGDWIKKRINKEKSKHEGKLDWSLTAQIKIKNQIKDVLKQELSKLHVPQENLTKLEISKVKSGRTNLADNCMHANPQEKDGIASKGEYISPVDICANCGHEEFEHQSIYQDEDEYGTDDDFEGQCRLDYCNCKQFVQKKEMT